MNPKDPKNYPRFVNVGVRTRLADILDFGPETEPEPSSEDASKRLMKLVQALRDLSKRIDELSDRM